MRIAVASEGLDVSPYFEHCASFTIYTIDCGIIVECQNMPNPQLAASRLAQLLRDLEVGVLIVGCIEQDVAAKLQATELELVYGVMGTARAATEAFLARTLIGTDEWCDYDEETPLLAEA
ncbi:MAG: NifB/NifX family molybdenum-iron cluster-binding protein [Raoultibacter sp.]